MIVENQRMDEIVSKFQIDCDLKSVIPYGSGNINDTYFIECCQEGARRCFVLQRINHLVFTDPPNLMDNILRVTNHIRTKLQGLCEKDVSRRVLTVIPTRDGSGCYQDQDSNYWRMYTRIERVQSFDYLSSPEQAFEAACMFGQFQGALADLTGPRLNETIPDFHNTPKRYDDFIAALENDSANRAAQAKPEIQFVLDHASMCDGLLSLVRKGQIPERIAHNDTKINNVLFDEATERGICVIDLDTVMPGLSLYDFGDMVRTATCQAPEDTKDLSKIQLDMAFYEQITRGYVQETADILTKAEKEHLVFAGKLITFEQMIRFLADYLSGDVYYKTHHPDHNLDRARTQMKLIQSIQDQEDVMTNLTEQICQSFS